MCVCVGGGRGELPAVSAAVAGRACRSVSVPAFGLTIFNDLQFAPLSTLLI